MQNSTMQRKEIKSAKRQSPRKLPGRKRQAQITSVSESTEETIEKEQTEETPLSEVILNAYRQNTKRIATYVKDNHILITEKDEHPFFKALSSNKSVFEGLSKSYFSPGAIDHEALESEEKEESESEVSEDSDNESDNETEQREKQEPKMTVKEKLLKVTQWSRKLVDKNREWMHIHSIEPHKNLFVISQSVLQGANKIKVGIENIKTLHASYNSYWLSTQVFDSYLNHVVAPDVARNPLRNHITYVPDQIIRHIHDSTDDTSKLCYCKRLQRYLLQNINIDLKGNADDVFCFGGHSDSHFFLLLMFVKRKEFVIVDPLDSEASTSALASLLHVMISHLGWLKEASDEEIVAAKKTRSQNIEDESINDVIYFNEEMMNDITVSKLKPGSEVMPEQKDGNNCGLYALLLCECYMRGFLPSFTAKDLGYLRAYCHLESSLATGVPLLGERSVYSEYVIKKFRHSYNNCQRNILNLLPDFLCFGKDNWQPLRNNDFMGTVLMPISDETIYFHFKQKIPGRKLFTKHAENSLLACFSYLAEIIAIDRNAKNAYPKATSGFSDSLKKAIDEWMKNEATNWFDANKNGMNDKYMKSKTSPKLTPFEHFGFMNVKHAYFENRDSIKFAIKQGMKTVTDLDVVTPYYFAFCHVMEVPLLIHTDRGTLGGLYTEVCDFMAIGGDIKYTGKFFTGPYKYQILAHRPKHENGWKFDVIIKNKDPITKKDLMIPNEPETINKIIDPVTPTTEVEDTTESPEAKETSATSDSIEETDTVANKQKATKLKKAKRITNCNLSKIMEKQFKKVKASEDAFNEAKNTHCVFDHETYMKHKTKVDKLKKQYLTGKRTLEANLRDNALASYEQIKANKRRKELPMDASKYRQEMLKVDPNLKERMDSLIERNKKNKKNKNWNLSEEDSYAPDAHEPLKKMVEEYYGAHPPRLSREEKQQFNNEKEAMMETASGKQKWEEMKKDDEDANQLSQLRRIDDDPDYKPYWQGKFLSNDKKQRATIINLSNEWVEYHFGKRFLKGVRQMANLKMQPDPKQHPNLFTNIPREQRWMCVPMGYNDNTTNIDKHFLKLDIPIQYPQGEKKSCLYTSVASAFHYMKYYTIADKIVKNMDAYIGRNAEIQWEHLQTLLKENNDTFHVAKFNFKRSGKVKKRRPKHTLRVEELTKDHSNCLDLHAVSLIGADGGRAHAIAVVNGLIFDSSATHAMQLNTPCLDWCCNCAGGYRNTGSTLRIKIPNCQFKTSLMQPVRREKTYT